MHLSLSLTLSRNDAIRMDFRAPATTPGDRICTKVSRVGVCVGEWVRRSLRSLSTRCAHALAAAGFSRGLGKKGARRSRYL